MDSYFRITYVGCYLNTSGYEVQDAAYKTENDSRETEPKIET